MQNFSRLIQRNALNFHFLEKGLGIVSPPHFQKKIFLMSHSINLANSII